MIERQERGLGDEMACQAGSEMQREHVDRIEGLESRMSAAEGLIAGIRVKQDSVWKDMYGNGKPGIVETVTGATAQIRLLVWMVGIGIAFGMLVATVFGIWFNQLEQNHRVSSPQSGVSLRHVPQNADLPQTYDPQ